MLAGRRRTTASRRGTTIDKPRPFPLRDLPKLAVVATAFYVGMCVLKVQWWRRPKPFLKIVPEPLVTRPPEPWCRDAELTDTATFIERRLGNRWVKRQGVLWEILFEDETWVYYGQPRTVFGPGGLRSFSQWGVHAWSRTDKAALQRALPSFRTLDGRAITDAMDRHIRAEDLEVHGLQDWTYERTDHTLRVQFQDAQARAHTLTFDLRTGRPSIHNPTEQGT